MTKEEATKVVAILMGNYPRYYKGTSKTDMGIIVNTWFQIFENDSYEAVAAALASCIAADEEGFPPAIGQVKAKIRVLTEEPQMTDAEAWNLVVKAIRKGDKVKSFHELPPVIQKCIGSPSILQDWGMVDIEKFNTVIMSNFQRSYRAKAKQEAEYKALPESVKRMLPEFRNLFLLEGGK